MGGLDPPIQGNNYRVCGSGWPARRPAMVRMREASVSSQSETALTIFIYRHGMRTRSSLPIRPKQSRSHLRKPCGHFHRNAPCKSGHKRHQAHQYFLQRGRALQPLQEWKLRPVMTRCCIKRGQRATNGTPHSAIVTRQRNGGFLTNWLDNLSETTLDIGIMPCLPCYARYHLAQDGLTASYIIYTV